MISRQNSVCQGLKFSSESKLFGKVPMCLRTTSATLYHVFLAFEMCISSFSNSICCFSNLRLMYFQHVFLVLSICVCRISHNFCISTVFTFVLLQFQNIFYIFHMIFCIYNKYLCILCIFFTYPVCVCAAPQRV